MENNRERARCCGAGGGVRAAFPDLANSIAYKRILEAKNTGAEIIVSCCPFCELSFKLINKEKNLGLQIKNITELVVESSRTI
jgi:Fe-S oxidoreductase